jgi:hypothetical protein
MTNETRSSKAEARKKSETRKLTLLVTIVRQSGFGFRISDLLLPSRISRFVRLGFNCFGLLHRLLRTKHADAQWRENEFG